MLTSVSPPLAVKYPDRFESVCLQECCIFMSSTRSSSVNIYGDERTFSVTLQRLERPALPAELRICCSCLCRGDLFQSCVVVTELRLQDEEGYRERSPHPEPEVHNQWGDLKPGASSTLCLVLGGLEVGGFCLVSRGDGWLFYFLLRPINRRRTMQCSTPEEAKPG